MASIFLSEFDKRIRVARSSETAQPWQAIKIYVGGGDISLSLEEAAQLAAELLNAAGVTPAASVESPAPLEYFLAVGTDPESASLASSESDARSQAAEWNRLRLFDYPHRVIRVREVTP